ncbi:MAG: alkaline phosphatase family protein, partial [bacterium]
DAGVKWKSYSDDFDFLRIFKKFRFKTSRLDGMATFYWDVKNGNLPAVSWINPNFADIGHDGNDDHPPADILKGQKLVATIYNALINGGKDLWKKTMFIVTYDEHGGFYDHVQPPEAPDDRPDFRKYGCRVPALVVSPWVKKGGVSHTVFDHTSILRTILLRFCRSADGSVPSMGARVDNANDLGSLLTEDIPRTIATPQLKVAEPRKLTDMPKSFQQKAQRPTELQDYVRVMKNEVYVFGNDKLVEPGEKQSGIPGDI